MTNKNMFISNYFKIKSSFIARFLLISALFSTAGALAQTTENSIFYEVTGKRLKTPSYLFGTFHLLGKSFVDSIPEVKEKLMKCKHMAGEVDLSDTTMMVKMLGASMLDAGVTLDQLIPKAQYDSLDAYVKKNIGFSIDLFKALKPMAISTTITAMTQKKLYPGSSDDLKDGSMDSYLQKIARNAGKQVHGLETIDAQVKILFNDFSLERQTEMLLEMMRDDEEGTAKMSQMNLAYRQAKLKELESLMYDSGDFKKEESQILLDNRNINWMKTIPPLMKDGGLFLAAGALHLSGNNGLVNLLRKEGYTVKPISISLKP
jgi:uncharacterized protein YbaP (TraB family)